MKQIVGSQVSFCGVLAHSQRSCERWQLFVGLEESEVFGGFQHSSGVPAYRHIDTLPPKPIGRRHLLKPLRDAGSAPTRLEFEPEGENYTAAVQLRRYYRIPSLSRRLALRGVRWFWLLLAHIAGRLKRTAFNCRMSAEDRTNCPDRRLSAVNDKQPADLRGEIALVLVVD